MFTTTRMFGLAVGTCAILMASGASIAQRNRVDSIKVSKRFYVASNGTLLISAVSSDAKAHLFLRRMSGVLIGEVQNGAGGKYGGTVFFAGKDPKTLKIESSTGGSTTFDTAPFHP